VLQFQADAVKLVFSSDESFPTMLIARKLVLSVFVFLAAIVIAAAIIDVFFVQARPSFVQILAMAIAAYPLFYIWWKK
jgi:hypothetical protein